MVDNNSDFIRIDRFLPEIGFVRGSLTWHRRLVAVGHDGSRNPFSIVNPISRNARREERIVQLHRLFNAALEKRNESRRRNVFFHLPIVVPLSPSARLVEDTMSYVSLQHIMDDNQLRAGKNRDEALLRQIDLIKKMVKARGKPFAKDSAELMTLKMEIFNDVTTNVLPNDVMTKFFLRTMNSTTDFWFFRRQVTVQLAAVTFITYIMNIGHRYPQKIRIACNSGNIWMSDLLPLFNASLVMQNPEAVPFRLTPNIQHFITDVGVEGIFAGTLAALALCLSEPEVCLFFLIWD
jgi:transformation/transcription domain-associated protein